MDDRGGVRDEGQQRATAFRQGKGHLGGEPDPASSQPFRPMKPNGEFFSK